MWCTAQTVTGLTISCVHSRCSCLYTQLYLLRLLPYLSLIIVLTLIVQLVLDCHALVLFTS